MNASRLKTECLAWLRYERGFSMVATECGRFSADVLAVSPTRIIEIETKISIADLRADFKKSKHRQYDTYSTKADKAKSMEGVLPNLFYFCLPNELIDKAMAYLDKSELPVVKKYGLLAYTAPETWSLDFAVGVTVVRKAQSIHTLKPGDGPKDAVLSRMSSELVGLHRTVESFHSNTRSAMEEFRKATIKLYDATPPALKPEWEEVDVRISETPGQSHLQSERDLDRREAVHDPVPFPAGVVAGVADSQDPPE